MLGQTRNRRTVRRRRIAGVFSFLVFLPAIPASAEDSPVDVILFGSMDSGSSVFFSSGFKAASDRVDREGFAMLAVVGAGARTERGPALASGQLPTLVRATGLSSVLGGYQFFFDWGVVGLFAGPEASFESLLGPGGFHGVETRFGARLQGEVWARPSAETIATVTVILGSARWDAYGRVSAGYRAFGAYVGPEVGAYLDRTAYRKWTFGLHATDFGFGDFRFRLSAGCAYESETDRLGPYVAVAGWVPL